MFVSPPSFRQGAVPKGNATKKFMESLQLKPGEVVYKCPKCCSIKPERAHHCRSGGFEPPEEGVRKNNLELFSDPDSCQPVVWSSQLVSSEFELFC